MNAELKFLPMVMYEVGLYHTYALSTSSTNAAHLWSLLTAARDFCEYVLSIPSDTIRCLPSTTFNMLPYGLVILSMVSLLPSGPGWDSVVAKREARATQYGQQIRAKYGEELTKTLPDAPLEQKDVWQFFSRGMGGLIAWHQRCENQVEIDSDYHIPITAPVAGTFVSRQPQVNPQHLVWSPPTNNVSGCLEPSICPCR
jgi:hypothetical protein